MQLGAKFRSEEVKGSFLSCESNEIKVKVKVKVMIYRINGKMCCKEVVNVSFVNEMLDLSETACRL